MRTLLPNSDAIRRPSRIAFAWSTGHLRRVVDSLGCVLLNQHDLCTKLLRRLNPDLQQHPYLCATRWRRAWSSYCVGVDEPVIVSFSRTPGVHWYVTAAAVIIASSEKGILSKTHLQRLFQIHQNIIDPILNISRAWAMSLSHFFTTECTSSMFAMWWLSLAFSQTNIDAYSGEGGSMSRVPQHKGGWCRWRWEGLEHGTNGVRS